MQVSSRRNVAVFGSTGSIGKAALEVISHLGPPFTVYGITANRRREEFEAQIQRYQPRVSICADGREAAASPTPRMAGTTQSLSGPDALLDLACSPEVDIVVAAIVGIAGLPSSLVAAENGKRLALANKESLVVAGQLLINAVQKSGAELLPVDSEHSAIFQAVASGDSPKEVRRIILTASGGSLRSWPIAKLSEATVADTLAHPTWKMGPKITVDSATMMNKALEVIEARWLFGLEPEKISVVIHPQSLIHSMVEFIDGSVIAQISPPDMRLPIQYALTYPARLACPAPTINWGERVELEWRQLDRERYPAVELGFEVAAKGGSCGAVLNAANEAAVEFFLEQKIRFTDIVRVCRSVLDNHTYDPSPDLTDLFELDRWSRLEVERWIKKECIT